MDRLEPLVLAQPEPGIQLIQRPERLEYRIVLGDLLGPHLTLTLVSPARIVDGHGNNLPHVREMWYTHYVKNIIYIVIAVAVALSANSLSAIWAKQDSKLSIWLLAVVLISPFVFITYGLVTARIGVAVASGTVDALLTISTIMVGLILFKEWDKLSGFQYAGIALSLAGIVLMIFSPYFEK